METSNYNCPNRCHRYRQSLEEIVEAGNKHREKALSLKAIAEEQKKKLSILREDKFNLQEDVDKMEMDARSEHENFMKMVKENIQLKEKMKAFEMELTERENVENEQKTKDLQHQISLFVGKNKDLEDEVLTKSRTIFELEVTVEKLKENEMNQKLSASQSLDKEINPVSNEEMELKNVVKELKAEIVNIKANEAPKRIKRTTLMNGERMLMESRKSNFDSLKQSLDRLKCNKTSFPRCFYGIKCRKMFCKFDHSHIFRKDNRTDILYGRCSPSNSDSSSEFLCDHCGEVCESLIELSIHVKRKHTGAVLNCILCDNTFGTKEALGIHVKKDQCQICDNVCASEDELVAHKETVHTESNQQQCDDISRHKISLRSHIGAVHEHLQTLGSDNEFDSEFSEISSISIEEISENENSETESGGSSS
jgi:hypothetical protein